MYYQLKNGKVIYLPTSLWLELSDQDLQDLEGMNVGEYATSAFYGSEIHKTGRPKRDPYDNDGIDYTPDSDELDTGRTIDINNIPDEELPYSD